MEMAMQRISMKRLSLLLLLFLAPIFVLPAAQLETKMKEFSNSEAGFHEGEIIHYNQLMREINEKIAAALSHAEEVSSNEEASHKLLQEVHQLKKKKDELNCKYHQNFASKEENYVVFDHEETTVASFVMDFGSHDFLYVVPSEIGVAKMTIQSKLPIPRESWNEFVEMVLYQQGIGIRQVNAYSRQLFSLKNDLLTVGMITADENDLRRVPDMTRVIYVFTPEPEHLKNAYHFFERFRDPRRTFVYSVGNKIALVSAKDEVTKLLQLYNAVWEKASKKVSKVMPLAKIQADEMLKILKAYFGNIADGDRFSMLKGVNEIAILPLAHENSLVLVGSKELVDNAESMIEQTEMQIERPCEMTVFWYSCKHSDPGDLAEVLEKVYHSLICYSLDAESSGPANQQTVNIDMSNDPAGNMYNGEIIQSPNGEMTKASNVVDPPAALPGTVNAQIKKSKTQNFIPHPKTGALMMVVRKDTLPKIKELLKKLDVPKKMVQIEVLLCERKIHSQTNSGLNILKLGSAASNTRQTAVDFESSNNSRLKGIFEFLINRPKGSSSIPAFDITYNFLMTQEDLQINASPSITTINQTPATITLVEEISINNGAAPISNNANITFEKSFTRAQFGITLVMTPTVHEKDPEQGVDDTLITLETNVTFDTPHSDKNDDRPRINRRHIENQVRVVDGQTVILGGLRKKVAEDITTKIPFLGEIPGIAKLFGSSIMSDQMTEMFVFITPKVIHNVKQDLDRFRDELLAKRPGDVPEFLERVLEAQQKERQKLFAQSFQLIFGS
jgi:general secretion pathway protein D